MQNTLDHTDIGTYRCTRSRFMSTVESEPTPRGVSARQQYLDDWSKALYEDALRSRMQNPTFASKVAKNIAKFPRS